MAPAPTSTRPLPITGSASSRSYGPVRGSWPCAEVTPPPAALSGVAVGEPAPGTEPGQDAPEGEPKPEPREPGAEEPASNEEMVDPVQDDGPGGVGEDGVVCAFAVPISAPLGTESAAGAGAGAGQLPRTGPYDRLLALTAIGSGLVLVGSGAALAGRRRAAHS